MPDNVHEPGPVANAVRAELARARVSGRQLAADLGWAYPVLWRRLRGEVGFSADEIATIAEHLDVPIARLYGPPAADQHAVRVS